MRQQKSQQRGVVLIVALIMMAVIGVSSAVALKSALSQDQISANQRARSSALQAAETSLRYCEASVTSVNITAAQAAIGRGDIVNAQPGWTQPATWAGASANVVVVPTSFAIDGSNTTFNRRPECLVEKVEGLRDVQGVMPSDGLPLPEAYVITARGFSPDYAERNNTPIAGSVVWLQSTIHINL